MSNIGWNCLKEMTLTGSLASSSVSVKSAEILFFETGVKNELIVFCPIIFLKNTLAVYIRSLIKLVNIRAEQRRASLETPKLTDIKLLGAKTKWRKQSYDNELRAVQDTLCFKVFSTLRST